MKMYIEPLASEKIDEYLQITDLTKEPNHVIGLLYEKVAQQVRITHPKSEVRVYRPDPIVPILDNYDRLLIEKDNMSRSSTYTHYVDSEHLLRTHTSAGIPNILKELGRESGWSDVVILLPGLVYRRDVTDRKHLSVLHHLEVWRIVRNSTARHKIAREDLMYYVQGVSQVLAKDWKLRPVETTHPYTRQGLEINMVRGDQDIELLECGLIHEQLLRNEGLDPNQYSGWASGMGLDRLAMIVKNLPDIRYLRSDNPRINAQMHDLEPYKEVSLQPAIKRDMSYCVPLGYVEEDLNEEIRVAMGLDGAALESIELLSETDYKDLPGKVRNRLGCNKLQKNVLVRITLRDLSKTLTKETANCIYERIYRQVNYGSGGYA